MLTHRLLITGAAGNLGRVAHKAFAVRAGETSHQSSRFLRVWGVFHHGRDIAHVVLQSWRRRADGQSAEQSGDSAHQTASQAR